MPLTADQIDRMFSPRDFGPPRSDQVGLALKEMLGASVEVSGPVSTSVPTIAYNAAGLITSYVSGGVTHTVGYDLQGRVITDSYGGTVETITYNASGAVQSYVVTGGATNQDVTSVTYTSGQVTGATVGGVVSSLVYNAQGRVSTYTEGATTRTVTYNVDGTVASYV